MKPLFFAKDIIYSVVIQFATGCADENAVTDVLDRLPHEDIERTETKTYDSLLNPETLEAIASKLPEPINIFFDMVASGINDLYVYLDYTEFDGIYEFKGSFVDNGGNVQKVITGAYYDSETGVIYGKNGDGILGIGYDYDAKQYTLQNPVYCWMRNMGFNVGYDIWGTLLFMDTDTLRIDFEALGRDWRIQLWKGNYSSLSNGAEIGIYYLEEGKLFNYTCIEDEYMPTMEMTLMHGDDEIFSRTPTRHWWLSGFQVGPAFDRDELTLNAKITFDSVEMASAFADAAEKESRSISVSLEDTTVSFSWK